MQRFVSIWFCHLKTDWMIHRQPELKNVPFVLALPDHGRMRITEVNVFAKAKGIFAGMVVTDAKIIIPGLQVFDDHLNLADKLLKRLCNWCIRFTPIAAVDGTDGLILDITGCVHLWGSEPLYLKAIMNKLKSFGFNVRAAIADTIGAAWAVCRYGKIKAIINPNDQREALMALPAAALRLDDMIIDRLQKLGLYTISSFMNIPRSALRRRFGQQLLLRLDQAFGKEEEIIQPLQPVEAYMERLPCLQPIQTAVGIEIALQQLLENLCNRLLKEGKGIRVAVFKGYRVDSKTESISISTNHPSHHINHLFKLFELKIATIEPALGIELFTLEASKVEDIVPLQETFWTANGNLESKEVAELLDHLESKFGSNILHRYLPNEHHLPEHSIKLAASLKEEPTTTWPSDKTRPIQLLQKPKPIEVTAPIPDYPPMNFRYEGKLHTIKKADACERIEAEWWHKPGLQRDYYVVEDEEGKRYWVFRSGHYNSDTKPSWFIHGFFA